MTHKEAFGILRDTPIDIRSTREDDILTLYATAQLIAMDCIEKQMPKKPIEIHEIRSMDNEGNVTCEAVYFRCPVCNKSVQIDRGCSNNECRQAIDWGKD